MNNLLKCEWYRLIHNKILLKWFLCGPLVVFGIVLIFFSMETEQNFLGLSGNKILQGIFEVGFEFILIYIAIMVTALNSKCIKNKTICYEIMYGHKWRDILLSKAIINGGSVVLSIFIMGLIFVSLFSLKNGFGAEQSYTRIVCVNCLIILLHIAFFFTLWSLLIRNALIAVSTGVIMQYLLWFLANRNQWIGNVGIAFNLLNSTVTITDMVVVFLSFLIDIFCIYIITAFICKERVN